MREIRNKIMQIDRRQHDPEILELIDLMIWKLEEFDNRITNLDRIIQDNLYRKGF
jgi:hypothetical protein